jgi:hypothetical protein
MRIVKAAAVQLSPVLYSRVGTVDNFVRKVHELGQEGVQFATFPETVVPYCPYFSFVQSAYQIIAGREQGSRHEDRGSARDGRALVGNNDVKRISQLDQFASRRVIRIRNLTRH